MNIALIGYGKMGKTIEQMAKARGHNIVLCITSSNRHEMTEENLRRADVAIEFTRPESAKENVTQCLAAGVNVVCGTTGWNEHLHAANEVANEHHAAFLYASNFSVGVNIFFEVNKLLATLMAGHKEYDVAIEETHHTQKKDAPSGTAITLADQVITNLGRRKRWALNDYNQEDAVPIIAHRVNDVPGTHKVSYCSPVDNIDIIHTAHNRDGFALGAVIAAEFLEGRRGIYSMKDVLGFK
jgi:4-hydroxy-tetrahydrodipicolinate reductase